MIHLGVVTTHADLVLGLPLLQKMSNYGWITDMFVLVTDMMTEEEKEIFAILVGNKLRLITTEEPFGSGFSRSTEEGGFDEVKARNVLLAIMRKHSTARDWLLLADADELFTYKFYTQIREADKLGYDCIRVECTHYLDAGHKMLKDYYVDSLHDPHIRVIKHTSKNGLQVIYQRNRDEKFLAQYENKTIHCVLKNEDNIYNVQGEYHKHLKYIIKPILPLGGFQVVEAEENIARLVKMLDKHNLKG